MASDALIRRLAGLHKALIALYESGSGMSAATRGREREQFVDGFLSKVLPPGYRFGTGDALDIEGNRSGQLDVVVEFTYFPSLPAIAGEPRLYFSEGVAAVVEVKSDLSKQWAEVQQTAAALKPLNRKFRAPGFTPYGPPPPKIPVFAVGYTGWKELDTVRRKANEGCVDGILIIDEALFSTRSDFPNGMYAHGPLALLAFVSAVHQSALSTVLNSVSPLEYASLTTGA